MKSRILTLRSASCFVTRASLAAMIPNGRSMSRPTGPPRRPSLVDSPSRVGDRRGPHAIRSRTSSMAKGKSPGRVGFTRMVSLLAFLPVATRIPDYGRLIAALLLDERMPNDRKVLLGVAGGYVVLG